MLIVDRQDVFRRLPLRRRTTQVGRTAPLSYPVKAAIVKHFMAFPGLAPPLLSTAMGNEQHKTPCDSRRDFKAGKWGMIEGPTMSISRNLD